MTKTFFNVFSDMALELVPQEAPPLQSKPILPPKKENKKQPRKKRQSPPITKNANNKNRNADDRPIGDLLKYIESDTKATTGTAAIAFTKKSKSRSKKGALDVVKENRRKAQIFNAIDGKEGPSFFDDSETKYSPQVDAEILQVEKCLNATHPSTAK